MNPRIAQATHSETRRAYFKVNHSLRDLKIALSHIAISVLFRSIVQFSLLSLTTDTNAKWFVVSRRNLVCPNTGIFPCTQNYVLSHQFIIFFFLVEDYELRCVCVGAYRSA